MSRFPMLDRYAAAAAQGEQDRLDLKAGRIDEYDLHQRRLSNLRKVIGWRHLFMTLSRTGRRDASEWAAVMADLQDDGVADWTYWLDKPGRRYRIRPWRSGVDGAPWSYRTPCITVLDGETGLELRGVPAGAFILLGLKDKLEDSDECGKLLFEVSAKPVKSA